MFHQVLRRHVDYNIIAGDALAVDAGERVSQRSCDLRLRGLPAGGSFANVGVIDLVDQQWANFSHERVEIRLGCKLTFCKKASFAASSTSTEALDDVYLPS